MFSSSLYSTEYDTLRLWLKDARKNSGLSIRDVAIKLGIHHSIVGKIEKGDRKLELFEFIRYCDAVGVSVENGVSIAIKANNKGYRS